MEPLIFDKGQCRSPRHAAPSLRRAGPRDGRASPGVDLRASAPRLPELAEPQVVRHYTRLSHLNHSVDLGFYPLGSCTNEVQPQGQRRGGRSDRIRALHPYQEGRRPKAPWS